MYRPVIRRAREAYACGSDRFAIDAVKRGMAPLTRRLAGLGNTPYARLFLTALFHNEALLQKARAYDLVPGEVANVLSNDVPIPKRS